MIFHVNLVFILPFHQEALWRFKEKEISLAERSNNLETCGLWAQHVSSVPLS